MMVNIESCEPNKQGTGYTVRFTCMSLYWGVKIYTRYSRHAFEGEVKHNHLMQHSYKNREAMLDHAIGMI